jgi:hypothetical protein
MPPGIRGTGIAPFAPDRQDADADNLAADFSMFCLASRTFSSCRAKSSSVKH